MNSNRDRFGELGELVTALFENGLSEAQEMRLDRLVADDADARQFYLERMFLHGRLAWEHRPELSRIELSPAPPAKIGVPESAAAMPGTPVLGFLGPVVSYVRDSRLLLFSLVALALTGWFVFQLGSVLLGHWQGQNARIANGGGDHSAAARRQAAVGAGIPRSFPHERALAWLSGSVGSRWRGVAEAKAAPDEESAGAMFLPLGTEFAAARQMHLVAGIAEITFGSGAKVVLTAPAVFSVATARQADLEVGKLSARIPHGAAGFLIDTPAGSVRDLGTEFGVEVTPEHTMEVQVYVGEVKIDSPAGPAAAAEGRGVRATAGQTVHVAPGKQATVVKSTDSRLHHDLTLSSDSRDKELAAYLDFVRKLKPVVWLRMEEPDGARTIHDEVKTAPAGKLHWDGPGNPFVDGRLGKGLWLRGPKLKDYAVIPDFPKAEDGKLSVVAWAYAESRPDWAIIVGNWRERVGSQFCLGLDRYEADRSGGDLDAGIVDRTGKIVHVREGTAHLFPLHAWQHVAMTTDGTTLRLYRQGREVASKKHNGLMYPSPTPQLGIGVSFDRSNRPPGRTYPSWWDGRVDEIAIFNKTLTADEIKRLAAAPPR